MKQAIEELKDTTGKEAHFLSLDLTDLASVKNAAEEYTKCVPRTSFFRRTLMTFVAGLNLVLIFSTITRGYPYESVSILPPLTPLKVGLCFQA